MGFFDKIGHALSDAANDLGHSLENVAETTAASILTPVHMAEAAVTDIYNGIETGNVFEVFKGFGQAALDGPEILANGIIDSTKTLAESAQNGSLAGVDFVLDLF